jgi:hypothetical protein
LAAMPKNITIIILTTIIIIPKEEHSIRQFEVIEFTKIKYKYYNFIVVSKMSHSILGRRSKSSACSTYW